MHDNGEREAPAVRGGSMRGLEDEVTGLQSLGLTFASVMALPPPSRTAPA
jgi:hypothetical protein